MWYYSHLRRSTGRRRRSQIRALKRVALITRPIAMLGGLMEKRSTRKPKKRRMVVWMMGFPVSMRVAWMASSLGTP